jgi:hypothetical protein
VPAAVQSQYPSLAQRRQSAASHGAHTARTVGSRIPQIAHTARIAPSAVDLRSTIVPARAAVYRGFPYAAGVMAPAAGAGVRSEGLSIAAQGQGSAI